MRADEAIARLPPPAWPGKPLDAAKVVQGSRIYHGQQVSGVNCNTCHADAPGANPIATPRVTLDGLGTDSRAAVLVQCDRSATGPLQGQPIRGSGEPLGLEESTGVLLKSVVLWAEIDSTILAELDPAGVGTSVLSTPFTKPDSDPAVRALLRGTPASKAFSPAGAPSPADASPPKACDDPTELGYKAAPLTGIWATAPYLHNGSVPTLTDLLKPAAARPRSFSMNMGTYDEQKVGIAASPPSGPTFDTRLWGNHNSGHDGVAYGTELSDADKQDLLEYLKSL
jgi:hypothetical protein